MKKLKTSLLTIMALATLSTSSVFAETAPVQKVNPLIEGTTVSKVTKETFDNIDIFKKAQITTEDFMEKSGLYVVKVSDIKGNVMELYVTKDLKVLIHSGEAIETDTGMKVKFPTETVSLNDKEDFVFGTGKEVLYVFTDPECPFCQNFEKNWDSLKDKYTFKVFLMPLSFHNQAIPMSYYIMNASSAEEKYQRLSAIGKGDTAYMNYKPSTEEKQVMSKKLDETMGWAKKNGVTGTPTVLDKDGNSRAWNAL